MSQKQKQQPEQAQERMCTERVYERRRNGDIFIISRECAWNPQTNACRIVREEALGRIVCPEESGDWSVHALTPSQKSSFVKQSMGRSSPDPDLVPVSSEGLVRWLGRESGLFADLETAFDKEDAQALKDIATFWLCHPSISLDEGFRRWREARVEKRQLPEALEDGAWEACFSLLGEEDEAIWHFLALRRRRLGGGDLAAIDLPLPNPPDGWPEEPGGDWFDFACDDEDGAMPDGGGSVRRRADFFPCDWLHVSDEDSDRDEDEDGSGCAVQTHARIVTLYNLNRNQPVDFFVCGATPSDAGVPDAAAGYFDLPRGAEPVRVLLGGPVSESMLQDAGASGAHYVMPLYPQDHPWVADLLQEQMPVLLSEAGVSPVWPDMRVVSMQRPCPPEPDDGREEGALVWLHVCVAPSRFQVQRTNLLLEVEALRDHVAAHGVEDLPSGMRERAERLFVVRASRGRKKQAEINMEALEREARIMSGYVIMSDSIADQGLAVSAARGVWENAPAMREQRVTGEKPGRRASGWEGDALRGIGLARFVYFSLEAFFCERLRLALVSLQTAGADESDSLAPLARETARWIVASTLSTILEGFAHLDRPGVRREKRLEHGRSGEDPAMLRLFLSHMGVI